MSLVKVEEIGWSIQVSWHKSGILVCYLPWWTNYHIFDHFNGQEL